MGQEQEQGPQARPPATLLQTFLAASLERATRYRHDLEVELDQALEREDWIRRNLAAACYVAGVEVDG